MKKRYPTIKSLVFDHVHRQKGFVDYEALIRLVLGHFPDSAWQRSHWNYYSYQIRKGRYQKEFSARERRNLATPKPGPKKSTRPLRTDSSNTTPKGPQPRDPEIKRVGDRILNHIRFVISLAAGKDPNLTFKLTRWVLSRLLQGEIRAKRPVKKNLWDSGMRSCQRCGERFASLKGVELHRKNPNLGYSIDNCELLCRECHQKPA